MQKKSFLDDPLTLNEKEILKIHLEHYRSLDSGSLKPRTKMEQRFILVCRGELDPKIPIEIAYLKYRRIQGAETNADIARNDRKNKKPNVVAGQPYPFKLKKSQKFEVRCNNCGNCKEITEGYLLRIGMDLQTIIDCISQLPCDNCKHKRCQIKEIKNTTNFFRFA